MEDNIPPSDAPINGVPAPLVVGPSDTVGSKRQRRPSVRLGDIGGDQPYDSHNRRTSSAGTATAKQWKNHPLNPSLAAKSSKTRALTNLETLNDDDEKEANNNHNHLDSVAIGSWRVKDFKKRGPAAKRVRSNWAGNVNVNVNGRNNDNNVEDKYSGGEDNDDEFDLEEQSPNNSLDNLGVDGSERDLLYHGNSQRRPIRARVSDEADIRRCGEDGIRIWLNSLGLGRYAPVFEIHEVDDEVLPLLTLEDLKDMGISAVGSRRKMFCAIQKLGKGFT